jgi:hypothetical protein
MMIPSLVASLGGKKILVEKGKVEVVLVGLEALVALEDHFLITMISFLIWLVVVEQEVSLAFQVPLAMEVEQECLECLNL